MSIPVLLTNDVIDSRYKCGSRQSARWSGGCVAGGLADVYPRISTMVMMEISVCVKRPMVDVAVIMVVALVVVMVQIMDGISQCPSLIGEQRVVIASSRCVRIPRYVAALVVI